MLKLEHRRSSIEVVADILRLGVADKSEIMYGANMSYDQLQKYLNFLLELKLVDKAATANQPVTYRVTKKGLQLLRNIDNMLEILEEKEPINLPN